MPNRFKVKRQHFASLGVKDPVIKIKLHPWCAGLKVYGASGCFLPCQYLLHPVADTPGHGSWFGLVSGSQVAPVFLDMPVPGLPGFLLCAVR